MDITVEPKADCTATLTASIPAEQASAERKAIAANYQAKAKLPGFRPGKVPASTIEKRFGASINEELLSQLFEQVCESALQNDKKLKVLNFGKPEHSIDKDGSYQVTTTMTIIPDFDLPEYKGIEVTAESEEVSDKEVDEAMDKLAERMADFNEVARPAAKGDVAIIDFTTSLDGKPVAEAIGKPAGFIEGRENQWMPVEDDSFLPGLTDGIVGMAAGDSKDINVAMSDDFPLSDLRGKTVVFHVTVNEVRERVTPEINAEFAERIMPGKTVEEIRGLMKSDLETRKKAAIDDSKADQVTEKLADLLSFSLPESLIETESFQITQRKMQDLIYSGTPAEEVKDKMDGIREEAKAEATRNLKVYFMLQEIAAKEGIAVSDQELTSEILRQASAAKKNPKSYIRELQRERKIHGIRMSLLTAKVLDFLVKEAKVEVSAK